jgi:hypothetical protein
MRSNHWAVGPHSVRPAGPPDRCFYCDATVGDQHRMGCVIRSRTVVVRTTIEHVVKVPEDWDSEAIEFSLNESSSCADNVIRDLDRLLDRKEAVGSCLCDCVTSEFVREATKSDEDADLLFITDAPS